jgi:hypothetical protein
MDCDRDTMTGHRSVAGEVSEIAGCVETPAAIGAVVRFGA